MRTLTAFILAAALPLCAQTPRRLDTATFVVLGEGLAAGMADFGLHRAGQEKSFPALVAKQMGANFPQPLLEAPGLGHVPGQPRLPVRVPAPLQTTVRVQFPPPLFVFNLSVPGMTVAGALRDRPTPPLVHLDDMYQTTLNFILGFSPLLLGENLPLWSQVESAEQLNPTIALVALGYADVLDGATSGAPDRLPTVTAFRQAYDEILTRVSGRFPALLAANIPDPFDTAYFTRVSEAHRLIGAPPDVLRRLYGVEEGDWLTIHGLMAIGSQLETGEPESLPEGGLVRATAAAAIRQRVQALNAEITASAQAHQAALYDLAALFRRVRQSGFATGSRVLTADYLGGFYLLNGLFPGQTGHAAIANELLELINRSHATSFPLVDVAAAAAADPAGRYPAVRRQEASE
ncbi:MAG: hypothetical protein IPM24_24470 [Bryobacterales bacterium]|nr:hypothetical protein [Bryobacterales bacterium]